MNVLARIKLPQKPWKPRPHQRKLWRYLMRGGKRAVAVWHRRSGKDEIALHACAVAMFERPANYWYMFPRFTDARKGVWDAVNPHTGRRRIDEAFPQELRESTRDHDMQIRFHNGSTFSVAGSDAVSQGGGIGSSVAGIVFSEFALASPAAWAFYRPILEENQGWSIFISTPRGRNHLFSLFQYAQQQPGWFCELLTARDTGALTDEALDEALKEYTSLFGADQGEGQFRQEYLCDWSSALLGSFFQRECRDVREEGRITLECEPPPGALVHHSWDLGIGDDTSVWFWSAVGSQVWIYDHVATSGVGLEWWRDEIERRHELHGWAYGLDHVPHDAKVRELGTGRTRVETMSGLGFKPTLVPHHTIDDGINAVRRTLPLCAFHPRCEEGGFTALEQYRREWDDEKKAFRASAVHDWTSHPADAFRYLSMAWKPAPLRQVKVAPPQGWIIPPPIDYPRRGRIRL